MLQWRNQAIQIQSVINNDCVIEAFQLYYTKRPQLFPFRELVPVCFRRFYRLGSRQTRPTLQNLDQEFLKTKPKIMHKLNTELIITLYVAWKTRVAFFGKYSECLTPDGTPDEILILISVANQKQQSNYEVKSEKFRFPMTWHLRRLPCHYICHQFLVIFTQ